MSKMSMQELYKEIEELKNNVSVLLNTIRELRKGELHFKKEIQELKNKNQNTEEQIRFLQEKNKMVNLATAIDPGEKEEMRLKIRELVREIDGCIAMIKN